MAVEFSDIELRVIDAAAAEVRGLIEAEQRKGVQYEFKKSSTHPPGKLALAGDVVDIRNVPVRDFSRAAMITQITGQHADTPPHVLLVQFEEHYEDMIQAIELKVAQDMGLYTPENS